MDNKPINQVLNQLEKYQETTRRLELLRYEIQHLDRVRPSEVIEMMTFQQGAADDNHGVLYPKAMHPPPEPEHLQAVRHDTTHVP